jgi:hypothetical protein|tara:strand:- start:1072 stop:1278 length:207 start_codon:yes stop_codon:yes gene_type:complete
MNSTLPNTSNNPYEYSTYVLATMFLVSEVLPLLKSKSNGMLHALLCVLRGSKCLATKLEEKVAAVVEA